MQRVYGVIDDEVFHRMNNAVDEASLSRAAWIGAAITEKLDRKDRGEDTEAMNLRDEVMKLRDENHRLNDELVHHKQQQTTLRDEQNDEAMKLRDENKRLNDELKSLGDEQSQQIAHLNDELAMKNDELDDLKQKIKEANLEAEQRWNEMKDHRSEATKLKKLLDESQAAAQHLKDDLLKKQSEIDQLVKTREELAVARMEAAKLKEAINIKNDEASFLRGHIGQLTQSISQFALKPSEEEIKKKGWWQFWKSRTPP
jgi:chromosome segregation ATPase